MENEREPLPSPGKVQNVINNSNLMTRTPSCPFYYRAPCHLIQITYKRHSTPVVPHHHLEIWTLELAHFEPPFVMVRESLGLQEIEIKIKMSALCTRNRLKTTFPHSPHCGLNLFLPENVPDV